MSSRIWPPPTEEEQAQLDDVEDNPFHEECESCESYPCVCNQCGDCECDPCKCDHCSICDYVECQCPSVYVTYYTQVKVEVDYEGDLTGVRVDSDVGEPDDVYDENGNSVSGELRERALRAVAHNDWPSWDIV